MLIGLDPFAGGWYPGTPTHEPACRRMLPGGGISEFEMNDVTSKAAWIGSRATLIILT